MQITHAKKFRINTVTMCVIPTFYSSFNITQNILWRIRINRFKIDFLQGPFILYYIDSIFQYDL